MSSIYLVKYPGKFWGVEGIMDRQTVSIFMDLKELNPFHQSGGLSEGYNFIEFWAYDETKILDMVVQVYPTIDIH